MCSFDDEMGPRARRAYLAGRDSERPLNRTEIREWADDAKAAFVAGRAESLLLRAPGGAPMFTLESVGADEAFKARLTGVDMAPHSRDGGAAWDRHIRDAARRPDEWDWPELPPEDPNDD